MKRAQKGRVSKPYRHSFAGSILIFTIAMLMAMSVAVPQAYAVGGDLMRPASSDSQTGKQMAVASVVDSVGSLIITGYQNLAGGSNDDYLTVKFNANGTVAWRKTYNRAGGSDHHYYRE